jgi:predicted aspartyl protease
MTRRGSEENDAMGHFHVDCQVINIRRPRKRVMVSNLLVDTGSEFTWVPEELLEQAGIRVEKKDVPFQMANGQITTRSTGYVIFKASEFETVDEVVFGQPGDLRLLGARTMEGFGALIDPRRKRLVAAGPNPAASGYLGGGKRE